jgi:MFS family permease
VDDVVGTRFALLWYAFAAGLIRIADNCVGVAVVLLALQRTHSPAAAGLIVGGYTLPALASGPVLGAWLDRTKHRKLALTANEIVLASSMLGLVATLGRAPLPWSIAIVAAAGVTLPLTSAGFTSLIPYLVRAERLPRANTLDAISFNGAAVLGPAIAGTLAAATSPATAVLVTAAIALAAIPATQLLRVPARTATLAAASLWATVLAGTRVMVRTPPLRGGTFATMVGLGAQGILAVGFPLFAVRLGSAESAGGALWGALEIGGLLGALPASRLLARYPPERVIIVGTALFGASIAAWTLAPSIVVAVLLVGVAGVVSGPLLVATFALRQRYAPDNLLAQVTTAGASLKIGAYALGAAVGGWLVPSVGPLVAIGVIAVLHGLAAAGGYVAAINPARNAPRDPARSPAGAPAVAPLSITD